MSSAPQKKQDIFSEFSGPLLSPVNRNNKKHCCNSPKITTPEKKCNGIRKPPETEFCGTPKRFNNKKVENAQNIQIQKCVTNVCEWCNLSSKRSDDLDFLYAFVSVNVKHNVLPQSFLTGWYFYF